MPEFKDVRTLQRTAEEMMRVRSTKAASQAPPTRRRPRVAAPSTCHLDGRIAGDDAVAPNRGEAA